VRQAAGSVHRIRGRVCAPLTRYGRQLAEILGVIAGITTQLQLAGFVRPVVERERCVPGERAAGHRQHADDLVERRPVVQHRPRRASLPLRELAPAPVFPDQVRSGGIVEGRLAERQLCHDPAADDQ
jgi:hypothetical protein